MRGVWTWHKLPFEGEGGFKQTHIFCAFSTRLSWTPIQPHVTRQHMPRPLSHSSSQLYHFPVLAHRGAVALPCAF